MTARPAKLPAIYAYIATEADGSEGIVGANLPGLGMTNFTFAYLPVAMKLQPLAMDIARASGRKVKLVKFSNPEVLEEL